MRLPSLVALALSAALSAAEADPLGAALAAADGDAFAVDRMHEALIVAPAAQRAALVQRIAASERADIHGLLQRMVHDDDPACAELAIDALAKRWPTGMDDVEAIRPLIVRRDRAGAAACRYAALVGDDEALPALAERSVRIAGDQPSETALRTMLALPDGPGADGWSALVVARQEREALTLSEAERLLAGSANDAIGAITMIAGMRSVSSRAARLLLAAVEHPDRTVRRMAASMLPRCQAPPAVAWHARMTAAAAQAEVAGVSPTAAAPVEAATQAAGRATQAPLTAAIVPAAVAPDSSTAWMWLAGLATAGLLGAMGWGLARRRRPQPTPQAVAPRSHITWAN